MQELLESINRGIIKGLRENNIELLADLDVDNLDQLDSIQAKSMNKKIDYSFKHRLIDSINTRQISRSLKEIINNPNNFHRFKGLIPANDKEHLKELIQVGRYLLGDDGNFNWIDTSTITDMSYVGFGPYFNGHIELWNVSNVINMHGMFYNAKNFNQEIAGWDVSNVTDMSEMFTNATEFNRPIGNWDVSNVTNMPYMFQGAAKFNQPIGDWNVSNVTDMQWMFNDTIFFDQPIGDWDVSNVTSIYNMFTYAVSFNQDISKWNISNLKQPSFKQTIFWACPILSIQEFMPDFDSNRYF